MTLDFIEKRIKEQVSELSNINFRLYLKMVTQERFSELQRSAKSQLEYFESEKQKLIANGRSI